MGDGSALVCILHWVTVKGHMFAIWQWFQVQSYLLQIVNRCA